MLQVPTVSKVYSKAHKVQQTLDSASDKSVPAEFIEAARDFFSSRWDMMHTPLHGAGYALDPEFLDVNMYELSEPMEGLETMINRLSPTPVEAAAASAQYSLFRKKRGSTGSANALANAALMPPFEWWNRYGFTYPELRVVAVRSLAQVVAATSCERDWSNRGHIHSLTRACLDPERVTKLTYCYTTLRMRDRLADHEREDDFEAWAS